MAFADPMANEKNHFKWPFDMRCLLKYLDTVYQTVCTSRLQHRHVSACRCFSIHIRNIRQALRFAASPWDGLIYMRSSIKLSDEKRYSSENRSPYRKDRPEGERERRLFSLKSDQRFWSGYEAVQLLNLNARCSLYETIW